jgi:deoxyribonuclease V
MKIIEVPAGWPADEAAALAVQDTLRARAELAETGPPPGTGTVTGVDVAYDDARDLVAAAAVVLDAATLTVVDRATAVGRIAFPYIPGLLAFRELPAVLAALGNLTADPGVIVCDGYGRAHPRRFGLASHLGVLTGLPAFGVAKNPFVFTHAPLGPERGDSAPLVPVPAPGAADGGTAAEATGPDPQEPEEPGRALRTRPGVKPVYVSAGHRVTLANACAHTLALTPRYRLPETTRHADRLCRDALAAATAATH